MIRIASTVLLATGLCASTPGISAHAASAPAAYAKQSCAAPATLTGQLAPWSGARSKLAAATSLEDAGASRLVPGRATEVGLFGFQTLRFGETGAHQRPHGFGGIVSFESRAAGRWRIVVGTRAWIDVVDNGKVVASSMQGRRPACSGIAKMVDFTLPAGRHTVLISSSPNPVATVLVVRAGPA